MVLWKYTYSRYDSHIKHSAFMRVSYSNTMQNVATAVIPNANFVIYYYYNYYYYSTISVPLKHKHIHRSKLNALTTDALLLDSVQVKNLYKKYNS